MPDRDYYLDPSPRMAEIRARYREHVAAVLKLAGDAADAEAKAGRIVELERRIADVAREPRRLADVAKGNNHWTRADFATARPGPRLGRLLRGRRPRQAAGVRRLAAGRGRRGSPPWCATSRSTTWKDYLAFHAVEQRLDVPPEGVRRRAVRLLRQGPRGHAEAARALEAGRRRHQRGARRGGREALRREVLPAAEKARAEAMVKNEIAAFGQRIDRLDWMAPETKAKAKAKLAVLKVGVGYPDRWRDYSGLEVVARRRLRQRRARRALRVPPQPRASSASRSTAASG